MIHDGRTQVSLKKSFCKNLVNIFIPKKLLLTYNFTDHKHYAKYTGYDELSSRSFVYLLVPRSVAMS